MNSLILTGCAVLMAAHAISVANFMSRSAPLTVSLEVILMFGFSIGSIISGYDRVPEDALGFLIIALVAKFAQVVDLLIRGYEFHISLLTCDFERGQHTFMYPRRRSTD